MVDRKDIHLLRHHWVRQRTLIFLRWLAVFGQIIALVFCHYVLKLDLKIEWFAVIIACSVFVNVIVGLIYPQNRRLSDHETFASLTFDLVQLLLLLYLSGGITNPMIVLVLAPIAISATILPIKAIRIICVIAIIGVTLLLYFNIPLQFLNGEYLLLPELIKQGTWVSLVIGIVFISFYAHRVSHEMLSISAALYATQLALGQQQKLCALGGVVAATAHELGTPLATIKLASSELSDELKENPDLFEDAMLIHSQADRCSQILKNMGEIGKEDLLTQTTSFHAVVEEAAKPHINRAKEVEIWLNGIKLDKFTGYPPMIARDPEIIHGLRNLVQNAVDFAHSKVWIELTWDDIEFKVKISDDGPGFSEDLFDQIGEPFINERFISSHNKMSRAEYEGMGLGLFIAKTLIEHSGANLTFVNRKHMDEIVTTNTGAVVVVLWPKDVLLLPESAMHGPLGQNKQLKTQ